MTTPTPKPLQKTIGCFGVYAIATGATLSAGFFLLPGIAFAEAGPAVILAYIIAAIPLVPAMLSKVELATAMPRAGGVYYFLDRSMGPMVGTIGGIGTWLALTLKVAFALIGMGAYLNLFIPNLPITPVAVGIAILLGFLNLFSAGKSSGFQIVLVVGLLGILAYFIGHGAPSIQAPRYNAFFGAGWDSILSTAGLVYISYVGVTKVASLSEEVQNPERNIPLGVFLSFATALIIYALGTMVMVGTLSPAQLSHDLTPAASAAEQFGGSVGKIVLSVAALLAFVSVANAGTLSASRYPLAMSRDKLLHKGFAKIDKRGIPRRSVFVTVATIVLILVTFDPTGIAKLASAFQLLLFAFVCLAVIVMREAHLDAYDPGYKAPFYPYLQLFGIVAAFFLIVEMGLLPTAFSAGLILLGAMYYWRFARMKVVRGGAVYHVFERLGRLRYHGLDTELRGILKEKGLRDEDPFDEVVARSFVVDCEEECTFEDVVRIAAPWVAKHVDMELTEVFDEILNGTRMGATPVTRSVALPHFRTDRIEHAQLVMARGQNGISLTHTPAGSDEACTSKVHAVFFLVSPRQNPAQHLRLLAQIAGHVEDDSFKRDWFEAVDEQELKEVLLREERWLSLFVHRGAKTEEMIGRSLREIEIPDGSLVAMLRRGEDVIVPRGRTVLEDGDRLTIIGEPDSIEKTYSRWFGSKHD